MILAGEIVLFSGETCEIPEIGVDMLAWHFRSSNHVLTIMIMLTLSGDFK